jgi:hypothetical protein
VAAECWADYRKKLAAWHAHRPQFEAALADWPATRAHLQSLTKPAALVDRILRAVAAPLRFAELSPVPSAAEVKFAFLNAPLIRHRLTLGDLLLFLNWDTEDLWQRVSAPVL